ncbi:orotate phosphoribosyltransferase [Alkalispirochaeta americana]|uniref:Orotate phosphoribosyltransferase n=1 Tax=Alkalispirochaeta americana TaxID=159291 RepID=A0A1N6Q8K9_9SPIO|nr:phosphoribosyltransferase family protein [Alkalispirochaeta americana]SIQ12974.1 orotate phosphoribosyltransferase [Alkalispirochaeta americana]
MRCDHSEPEQNAETVGREAAAFALEIGAVRLSPEDPFTWASGYRMPIYNDNRLLMRYPRGRALVRAGFLGHSGLGEAGDIQGVAGTASAGIAPAAVLAEALGTDFYYVRSSVKGHGLARKIEGLSREEGLLAKPLAGRRILLVEDLISTGGSAVAAAEALLEAGADLVGCGAIFSYGFDEAPRAFSRLATPCPLWTIFDLECLLGVAAEQGGLSQEDMETIRRWRQDPFGWGEGR